MIGLAVIIFALGYAYIAKLVYKLICKHDTHFLKKAAVIVVLIVVPYIDNIVSGIYLRYIAHINGGIKVYQSIDNVDGFLCMNRKDGFDRRFEQDIMCGAYKYIEANVSSPNEYAYTSEKGVYRFMRGNSGDCDCLLYDKINNIPSGAGYADNYPGYCITSNMIDNIKSKYGFRFIFGSDDPILSFLNIRNNYAEIIELDTMKVMGECNSYWHYGGWLKILLTGASKVGGDFPSIRIGKRSIFELLVYKVLKPKNVPDIVKKDFGGALD